MRRIIKRLIYSLIRFLDWVIEVEAQRVNRFNGYYLGR